MAADYLNRPPHEVRRPDKAVTDDRWIKGLLRSAPLGFLATVHDGQPFINSNLFIYDEQAHVIYMHSARVGRTRANVEAYERVCFAASEMGRVLPADTALEFNVEYAGAVVFGRARMVEDETEKERALQALLDKYAPHLRPNEDYRPPVPDEMERTSVYRIEIDSWSGKKMEAASDFPGAFWYDEHRQASPFKPGGGTAATKIDPEAEA
jgi:nitroimidazol reductase NimA-like FMN-containing flavoprotein (pyridoxamine 5'-phosphate oxidase superfamily)